MIQIVLTIFAWYRGWKWYSLIPVASAFIIGMFIGMSGGENIQNSALFADGLAIIALIIMCIVKPKNDENVIIDNKTEKCE